MKIIVLVKQVPDTWGDRKLNESSGLLDRHASDSVIDEIGERALEVALTHKDATGAEVVVLTVGPSKANEALRKGLAMGADSAIHILDESLAGADIQWTTIVLAAAIKKIGFDLVIAGNESTDGRGGMIPAMVAETLGVANVTFAGDLNITESTVSGERASESGSLSIHAPLPAICSITESSPEARFPNFKGIMRAKKKPLEAWSLADLGLDANSFSGLGRSIIISIAQRPERTAGIKVVDDGSAADQLAEFLVSNRLV